MNRFNYSNRRSPDPHTVPENVHLQTWGEDAAPTRWHVGDTIEGLYQVKELINTGMSTVYVCYDLEYKEPIVLKTYREEYLNERKIRERFKCEAETLIRLGKHPNIVRAEFVNVADGNSRLYILLEYIAGDDVYGNNLSGWIKNERLRRDGKPDLVRILKFAIQFCHGMMYAAQRFREMGWEFVHLDIKPANILISKDFVVKVSDFGLVRFRPEPNRGKWSFIMGEEAKGRLAADRLELLCGTPPYMSPEQFRGEIEIDVRADIYAFGCVLHEMVTGRQLSNARTFDEWRLFHKDKGMVPGPTGASKELDEVILKCLRKQRVNRYQDFCELEKDLSVIYRNLTGNMVRMPVTENAKPDAMELNSRGASLTTLGYYEEAIDLYHRALEIDPHYYKAYNNLGCTYRSLGQTDDAIAAYKKALKIVTNYPDGHINLGNVYKMLGRIDLAIMEYSKALMINPHRYKAYGGLGHCYFKQGKTDMAIAKFEEALRINPNYAYAHHKLGTAYKEQRKIDDAIDSYWAFIRTAGPDDDYLIRQVRRTIRDLEEEM